MTMKDSGGERSDPVVVIKLKGKEDEAQFFVDMHAKQLSGFLPCYGLFHDRVMYINKNEIEYMTIKDSEQKHICNFFKEIT